MLHHVTQTSSMSNFRCSFVADATSTSFSCDEGRSTPFSSYSPSLAVKYSSVRMWGKRHYLKVDGKHTHRHMHVCMHAGMHAHTHTHTQSLHLFPCHITHRYTPSHTISCPTFTHTSFTSQPDRKFHKLTPI